MLQFSNSIFSAACILVKLSAFSHSWCTLTCSCFISNLLSSVLPLVPQVSLYYIYIYCNISHCDLFLSFLLLFCLTFLHIIPDPPPSVGLTQLRLFLTFFAPKCQLWGPWPGAQNTSKHFEKRFRTSQDFLFPIHHVQSMFFFSERDTLWAPVLQCFWKPMFWEGLPNSSSYDKQNISATQKQHKISYILIYTSLFQIC